MARISTYSLDEQLNLLDKLVGTDHSTTNTKNFTLEQIIKLINDVSGIDLVDGLRYEYDYFLPAATDPVGLLNINGTDISQIDFEDVTEIIISKKPASADSLDDYIPIFDDQKIKITQSDDLNTFGIYKCTNVADHDDNDRYYVLTLTHITSNGIFYPERKYTLGLFAIQDGLTSLSEFSVTDLNDVTSAGSGAIITDTERSKLGGIESGATADQTDLEIETAYNNQVSKITQEEIEAANETAVRRFSPSDVKAMIDEHANSVQYTHSQNLASTTWTINHNLGKYPAVSIKFSSSDEVYTNVGAFAGVTYTNENSITINLAAAESGYAYLN